MPAMELQRKSEDMVRMIIIAWAREAC